jgi:succinoglycan biosynthesis protein ExoW
MSRIGVVVPFFQRTPGLLARTLQSIVTQRTDSELIVVVVDDASPVPPEPELIGLPAFRGEIVLRHQPNAGPGAARNAALDALGDSVDYISFLDPDDVWAQGHLERAEHAMAAGAEFYFADFQRPDKAQTEFQLHGFIGRFAQPVAGYPDIVEHTGDLIDTLLRFHVGTGTVVYDHHKFADLRFPTDYRNAHEDTLFWLAIARRARRVMVSEVCVLQCDVGVSVYAGAGWGSPLELCRLRDEVAFFTQVMAAYPLGAALHALMVQRRAANRADAARAIVHQATHGFPGWGCVRRYLAVDPAVLMLVPGTVARGVWQRVERRRVPPGAVG